MKLNKFNMMVMFLFAAMWSDSFCADDLQDGMRPVTEQKVKHYPHNVVVSLEIHYQNPRPELGTIKKAGTGFAISNKLVLTAAQNVLAELSGRPCQILCYQGKHGEKNHKEVSVDKYAYLKDYQRTYNENFKSSLIDQIKHEQDVNDTRAGTIFSLCQVSWDYALLYLREPLELTGVIEPTVSVPLDSQIICGYSQHASRQGIHVSYPFEGSAKPLNLGIEDFMLFETNAYPGMNGGPVRYKGDLEKWYAGSIISKIGGYTAGCRFTEDKLKKKEHWKSKLLSLQYGEEEGGTIFGIIEETNVWGF